MSSTVLTVTAADAATLKQVADAFRKDPTTFANNVATNPAALGLAQDSFSYTLNVDGQTSAGRIASAVTQDANGSISIPATQEQNQSSSDLHGFEAVPQPASDSAAPGAALYPSGTPSVRDVNQGQINDCALDAQLASLAQSNPAAIQHMITQDPAGGYDVTLYPKGQKTSVHVTQADLDAQKGTVGDDGKTNWASVIEVATIKAGQDYTNGSDPGVIMGLLTGQRGIDKLSASLGGSTASLTSALQNGKLISASASRNSGSIVAGHAYSVLGATADTVTVRNPWGDNNANDGVETLSAADFFAKFDGVQMQS